MKNKFILFICCSLAFSLSAQNFIYNVKLDHYFDNREYDNPYSDPQTLFGIRVSPEIGWKYVDSDNATHHIKGGIHYLQPIGSQLNQAQFDPFVYYQYIHKGVNLHFGIVPYSEMIQKLPSYVMSDSLSYLYPNIQGALFQYMKERSYVEILCDWRGAQSTTTREAFRVIVQGKYYWKHFSFGGVSFLNHLANKAPSEPKLGVCDDYFVSPNLGLHWSKSKTLDSLSFGIAYLFASTKERITDTKKVGQGIQWDCFVKWKFLAIQNSFYVGNNLLPFYHKYHSGLHLGDPFYQATRYNRTSLILYLIQRPYVQCQFSWNLHFTKGNPMGNQQLLTVHFNLDALTHKN